MSRRIPGAVSPARNTDPNTSHQAAAISNRDTQRVRVLDFLRGCGDRGATDYETSIGLDILRTSGAKRRLELMEMGLVVRTP